LRPLIKFVNKNDTILPKIHQISVPCGDALEMPTADGHNKFCP
jgi:hypothetical protein